ncbi:MAG: hypothetical protein ACTHLW_06295 [Verrucomicrobiota bacterium]
MKLSHKILILAPLALTFWAVAQVCFRNEISSAEAAKIVCQLPLGTAEREMITILETNGLKWALTKEVRPVKFYPSGMSMEEFEKNIATIETNAAPEALYGYALLDNCVLRLHVSLESGASTNRVLRSASIESNGVQIASITLKRNPNGQR